MIHTHRLSRYLLCTLLLFRPAKQAMRKKRTSENYDIGLNSVQIKD